jgi:signal transduction histidine kinase
MRPPRTTVRRRLAALYGGVFLASGAGLLAITYLLVRNGSGGATVSHAIPSASAGSTSQLVVQQHNVDLHALLVGSSIALAIMTIASVAAGWLLAGGVLRPLRTMTDATQQISEVNLHRRLDLSGPDDELKALGDTIDGLLARLESAFDAQRSFVANASHELRTPVTVSRAMLQVALSDPGLTLDTLRSACEDAIDTGRQQERLIEALLTLARSERGLEQRAPVDLAAVVTEVVRVQQEGASARGVHLDVATERVSVSGDAALIERLVANLVENAVRYNHADGAVRVGVRDEGDAVRLRVVNTGPVVPSDQISRLVQPFQRASPDRVGGSDGLGLGLSIVRAISTAHGARLRIGPGVAGGLDVEVLFRSSGDSAAVRHGRTRAISSH